MRRHRQSNLVGSSETRRRQDRYCSEVFAVDKDLIPNSQRDYFIENHALQIFEAALTDYFTELQKVYYQASSVNSALRVVENLNDAQENFSSQTFVSKNHRDEAQEKLDKLRTRAEASSRKIERQQRAAEDKPEEILSRVANRILENSNRPLQAASPSLEPAPKIFSRLKRNERKLVLKILDIIRENTDAETFKTLRRKIEEGIG